MSYAQTLAEMVEKSGLTLKEIASNCKDYHVKIDPSYISKLQKGKQAPASEDINIALAKSCGGDHERLLFEAYMDKAPDLMKNKITNITDAFRGFIKAYAYKAPRNSAEILDELIVNIPDYDLIKLIEENGVGLGYVPLESYIDEGYLLKAGEEAEKVKVLHNELFRISIDDTSMAPLIPKGSKIQLDSSEEKVNNGDIVLAEVNKQHRIIRRYELVGNKIVLVPMNKLFDTMALNKKDVTILGKVKEVITEL